MIECRKEFHAFAFIVMIIIKFLLSEASWILKCGGLKSSVEFVSNKLNLFDIKWWHERTNSYI